MSSRISGIAFSSGLACLAVFVVACGDATSETIHQTALQGAAAASGGASALGAGGAQDAAGASAGVGIGGASPGGDGGASAGAPMGGCDVPCPAAAPCFVAACIKGACTTVPADTGTLCEDGNPCTEGDSCDGIGHCTPGSSTEFQTAYGGTAASALRAIVALPDGGFASAGNTEYVQAGNGYDGALVRTDATGKQLWQKAYGGKGSQTFYAMAQTLEGGFVLAGYTEKNGGGAAWVVGAAPDGSSVWQQAYDGGGSSLAAAVSFPGGGTAVAGMLHQAANQGQTSDAWIFRIDESGKKLWEATVTTPRSDAATAMTLSEDGDILVVGYSRDVANEKYDAWVLRLTPTGETVWRTILANDLLLAVSSVVALPGGGAGVLLDVFADKEQQVRLVRVDKDGAVSGTTTLVLPDTIDSTSQIQTAPAGKLVIASNMLAFAPGAPALRFTRLDEAGVVEDTVDVAGLGDISVSTERARRAAVGRLGVRGAELDRTVAQRVERL